MTEREWEGLSESEFDTLLRSSLDDAPPDDVVSGVTPWRRATNRALAGLALNALTLNFLWLDYILPAIGMILALLGFRTLRRENGWFTACWAVTAVRAALFFALRILDATIVRLPDRASYALLAAGTALMFVLLFCLWMGFKRVKLKAGLPPKAGGAAAMIAWYAVVCALALTGYSGWLFGLPVIVGYIFIIRSLVRLSKELDEAGYAVRAAPVRVADRHLVYAILSALVLGIVCGCLFFSSYRMDWREAGSSGDARVEEIKSELLQLGFTDYVLDDLSDEDVLACEGALRVVAYSTDNPVNDGREVRVTCGSRTQISTVYDVKELRITGVGVLLPGEREEWRIFHHFLWTTDPGFYGTESIQLWTAYSPGDGWAPGGELTGRVLYDDGGVTYAAPYHSLGGESYTSNSVFWGEQQQSHPFAAFSFPRRGEAQRGYVTYTTLERQDGYIIDSWVNYTHQRGWFQYPVMTAKEKRMSGSVFNEEPFITVQDALQFYYDEHKDELEVIGGQSE